MKKYQKRATGVVRSLLANMSIDPAFVDSQLKLLEWF